MLSLILYQEFFEIFLKNPCNRIILLSATQKNTHPILPSVKFDLTSYIPLPKDLHTGIPIGQKYSMTLMSVPMILQSLGSNSSNQSRTGSFLFIER